MMYFQRWRRPRQNHAAIIMSLVFRRCFVVQGQDAAKKEVVVDVDVDVEEFDKGGFQSGAAEGMPVIEVKISEVLPGVLCALA